MSEQEQSADETPERPPLYKRVAVGDQSIAEMHAEGEALIIIVHGAATLPPGSTLTLTLGAAPAQPEQAPAPQRYIGEGRPPARPPTKG